MCGCRSLIYYCGAKSCVSWQTCFVTQTLSASCFYLTENRQKHIQKLGWIWLIFSNISVDTMLIIWSWTPAAMIITQRKTDIVSTDYFSSMRNCSVDKMSKKVECVTSSNCFLCQKLKDSSFAIINDNEKQLILTLWKLEPAKVWYFVCKMTITFLQNGY